MIHLQHGMNEPPEDLPLDAGLEAWADSAPAASPERVRRPDARADRPQDCCGDQAQQTARKGQQETEALDDALHEMAEALEEGGSVRLSRDEGRAVWAELARLRRAAGEPKWRGEP